MVHSPDPFKKRRTCPFTRYGAQNAIWPAIMHVSTDQQTRNHDFEFQKWPVYREAIVIAKEAQKLCLNLPKNGNQSLGDQFRRASQSVPLNIAEGSSRTTTKDKVNFMRIAKGSVFECAAVVDLAFEFELIDFELYRRFQSKLANVGRMISGMIRHLEKSEEKKHQSAYGA